jgi:3-phenylpropionate/cinnamic acid dioxygenase small subunit
MSEAHEAIRNLLGTYCELVDSAAWAEVGELFADAEMVGADGRPIARGAAAVAAMFQRVTHLHEGSPRTRHITSNTVIDVHGAHASSRSAYVVFQGTARLPLQPIISGRYLDEFLRDDDGWRFARRQVFVDHAGDVSHHLTDRLRSL